jgi:hypothetical protein
VTFRQTISELSYLPFLSELSSVNNHLLKRCRKFVVWMAVVSISLHAYTPTHLHAYTPTRLHAYTPTRLHAYTPTRLHTCTPTRLCPTQTHTTQLTNPSPQKCLSAQEATTAPSHPAPDHPPVAPSKHRCTNSSPSTFAASTTLSSRQKKGIWHNQSSV